MSQNIHFVKGEVFHKEEGKCIEFKREIDSTSNFVNGIVTLAEKYVIGFLNAIIEGELYIGIDNSGIIVGIPLNRDDRDKRVYRLNHADLALTYPEAFAEQRFQPKMCSC